jgi:hypothetical protein
MELASIPATELGMQVIRFYGIKPLANNFIVHSECEHVLERNYQQLWEMHTVTLTPLVFERKSLNK